MLRSMTAYARQDINAEWGTATWEIRSFNQRYLETYIRMPEQFRNLESAIRDKIRARLTRGKVECLLRFELSPHHQGALAINKELANSLINAAQWIKLQSGEGTINPIDILRWPHVLSTTEQDVDVIGQHLLAKLDQTLDEFIKTRAREGKELKTLLEQRLKTIKIEVKKVRLLMPKILQWQREKLQHKLEEAKLQLDHSRLEQELVFLAQRIDVAEELDRLDTHIKETLVILNKPDAVGRRLDFMMQEFNREANTLAAKSINSDVTTSAVEIKVLIEQMREQIQNIE